MLPLLPQAIRVGGAFDFDDFGTQIAKQSAQLAPGDDDAEVDDTDARQWPISDRCVRSGFESSCAPADLVATNRWGRGPKARTSPVDRPVADRDADADARGEFNVDQCAGGGKLIRAQRLRRSQNRRDRHRVALSGLDKFLPALVGELCGDE